jgi:hypothetical protein
LGYRRLKNSLMRVRKRIEAKERKENLRASLKVLRRKEEPEPGLVDGKYPEPKPPKCLMTGPATVRYMNSFSQGSRTCYLLKGIG